jgi:IS605 OrfB family transposase
LPAEYTASGHRRYNLANLRRFHTLGVENLNVRERMKTKNQHLVRSIANMDYFKFRRPLEYKAAMRGGQVVVADRFFASRPLPADFRQQQDVFDVWAHAGRSASGGARMDVPGVRHSPRPRRERSGESAE